VKILVIQTSRFGDLIQTTPMLHVLRRKYPEASITVLSRYNVMEIYKENPDVDYVELFNIEEYTNRLLNNSQDLFNFYTELRDAVNRLKLVKFDLVINSTHDRFSSFLAYLIRAPETKGMFISSTHKLRILVSGFWFRYLRCTSEFREIASFNLADIYKNAVGGSIETRDLFFNTPSESLQKADDFLSPAGKDLFVGFQLGTSTGARRWPLRYFIELGNLLQEIDGIRIVLLGSKNESDLGEKVMNQMTREPINLIGKTDITGLAGILNRCALLVTNDTGTMHLAEAVGTKCVALFFESANPFQTGPYGAGHIICSSDLDCFPCPTIFKCNNKKCLDLISVETVFRLVNYKLGKSEQKEIQITTGMRVHETRFNQLGVWDALPIDKMELSNNDLIRRVYRNMWISYAEESEELDLDKNDCDLQTILTDELNIWLQNYEIDCTLLQDWLKDFSSSLNLMEKKTNAGITLLGDIIAANNNDTFDGSAITKKSNDLGKIDQEIIQLGRSDICLAQLSNLSKLELEQIEGNNFFKMLNDWKYVYDVILRRVKLLREEIEKIKKMLN